ncbi:MAG: DUF1893 domain-containing protein [Chloroflexi bacterium]|nr:DUF1893 domain-containing protein [Chloroflexota bacterium]
MHPLETRRDLDLARVALQAGAEVVLAKEGLILGSAHGQGIGPLLDLLQAVGGEAQGSALADRVVGRAAALLVLTAGISAVYTPFASEAALAVLQSRGIWVEYDRSVPLILNRKGDGPCPYEALVSDLDDPAQAREVLLRFVEESARAHKPSSEE